MKAAGVGLNLTAANNIFLVDPWWNPAVEEQAIDRVHRIGQTKDVNVIRFLMEGSIEERMHEICKLKKSLFHMTIVQSREESKAETLDNMKFLLLGKAPTGVSVGNLTNNAGNNVASSTTNRMIEEKP